MFYKRILEYLFLWFLGGILYYLIEIIFRGFSHWSMFILGGICMVFFALQGRRNGWSSPLWIQVLRCTFFITVCEFITGMIVNKWLNLNVWDYSNQPFHLYGQICLPFMILFSGLATVGIILCGYLLYFIFGEEKPRFRVL